MREGLFFIQSYASRSCPVVIPVIVALWRMMKAQEATADALERIANAIRRIGPGTGHVRGG